jgi:hypothetical protein
MKPWYRSDVPHARMEGLIMRGLLHERTKAMEWLMPDHEEAPAVPDGYVMSFTPFHERELVILPHSFL